MDITYDDIVNRWPGQEIWPVNETVTDVLIQDSEAIIKKEFPDIEQRIENGELSINLVKQVVARMIINYIQGGNGLSQHTKTVGPYTESRSYSSRFNRGYLQLTEEDKELLAPKGVEEKIGSIDTIGQISLSYPYHPPLKDGWEHWRYWGV